MAVPTVYQRMLDFYDQGGELGEFGRDKDKIREALKGIRVMISGSASLSESVFQRW